MPNNLIEMDKKEINTYSCLKLRDFMKCVAPNNMTFIIFFHQNNLIT